MAWFTALTLFLVSVSLPAEATEDQSLPVLVRQGLQVLQEGRCRDAFDQWTAHWTSEGDALKRQQLSGSCDVLTQLGGKLAGYDAIKVVDVTPHLRRAYVLLRYEKQPIFLVVVIYSSGGEQWKVMTLNWHSDPDKILPPSIAEPLQRD